MALCAPLPLLRCEPRKDASADRNERNNEGLINSKSATIFDRDSAITLDSIITVLYHHTRLQSSVMVLVQCDGANSHVTSTLTMWTALDLKMRDAMPVFSERYPIPAPWLTGPWLPMPTACQPWGARSD